MAQPIGPHGFSPAWRENGFRISCTLPLDTEIFPPESSVAHNFFANLLPEGRVREHIVRDLKIADTDFELLRAIGGECAGALSLLVLRDRPPRGDSYRLLSPRDLADLVNRRGYVYGAFPPNERPRLSLAGAQDKVALLVRDGDFLLPKGASPSTHIVKFELAEYRHVPAYETFLAILAGKVGLPAAEVSLLQIAGHHCSMTTRYDRRLDERGKVHRIHQEDFCQALDYPPGKKYEDAGGPSFRDCFKLVRDVSSEPAIDAQQLLRWQIFNLLSGNSDGHAKNLSLVHLGQGVTRLAPFYDIVCTRAIERIDSSLALSIGGERGPGKIRAFHWDRLASECDVGRRLVHRLVEEMASALSESLGSARDAFEERFGPYPALQGVEGVVEKQCRLVLKTLDA